MSKFNAHFAPSRRGIIKGAGALAAGVAAIRKLLFGRGKDAPASA